MTRFRLTIEAKEDLIAIWDYSNRHWGATQADQYLYSLETCFSSLDTLPTHDGRDLVPDSSSNVRFHRHGSHYIFFRKADDGVEVLTVIHSVRQGAIERFLADS